MPAVGFVEFTAPSLGRAVTVRLGDGSPTVSATTGWGVLARPRNVALTDWQGREPMRLTIPVLFDAFAQNDGVTTEAAIATLERFAGIGGGSTEPPIVTVDAAGVVPHDAHDSVVRGDDPHKWVVESLTFGDAVRNAAGNRVRQAAEVVLLQFVDATLVVTSPAKRRKAAKAAKAKGSTAKGKGSARSYVVRQGDTLSRIAARPEVYGDASRWRYLADENNIRDPNRLRVGQTLRIAR